MAHPKIHRPAGTTLRLEKRSASTIWGSGELMYEHSYHIDYGAKAATYADTFMKAIRWSNADSLFASYSK